MTKGLRSWLDERPVAGQAAVVRINFSENYRGESQGLLRQTTGETPISPQNPSFQPRHLRVLNVVDVQVSPVIAARASVENVLVTAISL